MTSETDEQFVELMQKTIWEEVPPSCRARLFALARRGAAQAAEIERLRAEVERLTNGRDTMGNLWAKGKEDNERLRAAIAIIRGETLEEAAREIERQLYVERHPLAQAIRALKDKP